jgi:hypothetical protein
VTHNPYTPPSVTVADVPEPAALARPTSVKIAVALFFAGLVIEVAFWTTTLPAMNRGEISPLAFFAPMVGFFIAVWLCIKVFAGRNWARMTMLVWTCLVFIVRMLRFNTPLPEGVMARPSFAAYFIGLQSALILVALYLLFVPGREWFRGR